MPTTIKKGWMLILTCVACNENSENIADKQFYPFKYLYFTKTYFCCLSYNNFKLHESH